MHFHFPSRKTNASAPSACRFWDAGGAARIVAMLMICAGLLDALTTEIGLRYADAWETNPVVRGLRDGMALYWILPKMAAHGLLAYAVIARPKIFPLIVFCGVALVTLLAASSNFSVILAAWDSALRGVE